MKRATYAVALAVVCLVQLCAAQKCGNTYIGTWEGKLRVVQETPSPALDTAISFLTAWTYTRLVIEADANTIEQTYVGQDYADQLVCEYTCSDDVPVGHAGELQITIQGGIVNSGSTVPFECPQDPNVQPKQLVARCSGDHIFAVTIRELPRPNGTWTHEIEYIASGTVNTPYMQCPGPDGSPITYSTQGFLRPYVPPQITAGWYTRGGTYVLGVMCALFVGGWLYLFANVKWNEFDDPALDSQSEDDDDSESEGHAAEGDSSGSDSEGSESGSESDGESEYTVTTGVTSYTDATGPLSRAGSVAGVGAPPAFHCPQCGGGIHDEAAVFCSNCGHRFDSAPPTRNAE